MVMAMKELSVAGSMAQRIVMYPRAWDEQVEGRRRDANVETSRRLLRKAAKDYKVMLQPIESVPQAQGSAKLTVEEAYPLTNLLTLVNYNRILLLEQPGLILDSTPLDLLFTLPMENPLMGLSDPQDESREPVVLIFESSKETYQDVGATLPEGAYLDTEFLQKVSIEHAPEDSENKVHLLATTSLLENESSSTFNATDFLDMTAYVHLSDPGMPGPEFVVPRQDFVRAMPSIKQARKAWEAVYERFRDLRIDVCGLDLEPVETRPEGDLAGDDSNQDLK